MQPLRGSTNVDCILVLKRIVFQIIVKFSTSPLKSQNATGIAFAIAAYLWWGIVPIYWKFLGRIPAFELVSHRVIGSLVWVGILVTITKNWTNVFPVFRDRKKLQWLIVSSLLISLNWGIFLWSVQVGRLLEASLGYYINPLINVVFGVFLLRERLRIGQWAAILIAGVGVILLTLHLGVVPWISLILAVSFAFYALLRKFAPVDSLTGLFVETALITPFALVYILWLEVHKNGIVFQSSPSKVLLLSFCGLITALPLLWFASAARRLPLSTLGLFQYISPTFQFLLAVLAFNERFTTMHAIAFVCIWVGLIVFTIEPYWTRKKLI